MATPTDHERNALRADFRRTQYISDLVEPGIRGVSFLYDHGASVPGEHGTMAVLRIRRHLDLRSLSFAPQGGFEAMTAEPG